MCRLPIPDFIFDSLPPLVHSLHCSPPLPPLVVYLKWMEFSEECKKANFHLNQWSEKWEFLSELWSHLIFRDSQSCRNRTYSIILYWRLQWRKWHYYHCYCCYCWRWRLRWWWWRWWWWWWKQFNLSSMMMIMWYEYMKLIYLYCGKYF